MTTETEPRKRVRYEVRQLVDADQLKRDMTFSPTDLTSAMMEQASLFAHYGILAAKASRQVDDVKMLLENVEAKVYRKVRDEAASTGVKLTEAQVEKQVVTHEHVISFRKALNEAKQIEAVAKTAVEAFRHRRDMLVQQGLISREEMKGELSIAAKRAHEDELEALKGRYLKRLQDA